MLRVKPSRGMKGREKVIAGLKIRIRQATDQL